MKVEKITCSICNKELHKTYFANGHDSVRCMNCEKKHPIQDDKEK